jgi:hypothetical protein
LAFSFAFRLPTDEHDDEIARLEKILRDKSFEFHVLVDENRRHIVCSMPEYEPYDRLVTLRIQHSTRMADLIDRMWTIPAHTEAWPAGKGLCADMLRARLA